MLKNISISNESYLSNGSNGNNSVYIIFFCFCLHTPKCQTSYILNNSI